MQEATFLILTALSAESQHGYGISQAIRLKSGELFDVETGSLYPALHRLERSGWISSDWKTANQPTGLALMIIFLAMAFA